jgi:hypothetical protein
MATKYTILETAHTEESDSYSRKERAVRDADLLAEQYPGTEFAVATSSGKVVHKIKAEVPEVDEGVDPAPVDDVPEVQVDTADADADFDPEDPDNDVATDTEPETDDTPEPEDFNALLTEVTGEDEDTESETDTGPDQEDEGDAPDAEDDDAEEKDAEEEGTQGVPAPAPPADSAPAPTPLAAPAGATLELCAPNTNAKRMHYRPISQQRTVCGSANTSRRANQHQIETASLCPNCEKLAKGQTVDTRPAGAGRGSGSRKRPKRLVMDAGEVRDLVAHLKQGMPYSMELTDGTRVEIVAGDPQSHELDDPEKDNLSDIRSINIVSS